MHEYPSDNPFGNRISYPLPPEDIEEIEESMNELIRDFYPPGEKRDNALEMGLPDKIEVYIAIAEHAETDPDLKSMVGPELKEGLRELLTAVNAYFHRLN
ncbi:MAG: hypothetical protein IT328_24045 [Caldilineaceae bacterium]|nr:hypothetical protein [Caldilineaceae bacterium]